MVSHGYRFNLAQKIKKHTSYIKYSVDKVIAIIANLKVLMNFVLNVFFYF